MLYRLHGVEALNKLSQKNSSPVNVPFVEEEPFFGLGKVDVDILVDAAHNEYLVIIAYWLGAEELFRLFERAIHALDLILLGVEGKAIRDPSIVSAKDQNLAIVQCEATHGVAGTPVVFTVDEIDHFPSLAIKFSAAIQSLNAIKRLLVLRIAATNNVDEAILKNADRVIVA